MGYHFEATLLVVPKDKEGQTTPRTLTADQEQGYAGARGDRSGTSRLFAGCRQCAAFQVKECEG